MTHALIINLFVGPSGGKTTFAHALSAYLSARKYDAAEAEEQIQRYLQRRDTETANNQIYITACQYQRVLEVSRHYNIVVCDSPILIGIMYPGPLCTPTWEQHVWEMHRSFNNLNIVLRRHSESNGYKTSTRKQKNLEEAKAVDGRIVEMLNHHQEPYLVIDQNEEGMRQVQHAIDQHLRAWEIAHGLDEG